MICGSNFQLSYPLLNSDSGKGGRLSDRTQVWDIVQGKERAVRKRHLWLILS